MRDLLRQLVTNLDHQRDLVYCCLVETKGSTPQKAGAVMLVYPDGSQTGTLGGGCIEAEVKRRALATLHRDGRTDVLTFSLDNDYGWDDGLICGGRMKVLVAPLTSQHPASIAGGAGYYRAFEKAIGKGEGCVEAIVIEEGKGAAIGSRYLFNEQNVVVDHISPEDPVPTEVIHQLPDLQERPRPFTRTGIAYLPFSPRITLLIVGGGHVGKAVAALAADLDFAIQVVDDREVYANRERFPTADRILVGDIGLSLKKMLKEIDSRTYAIIVTRGHNHDEEALYHLIQSKAGYVGMIGSKRKIRLIFEDLIAKGISEKQLAQAHAPLGLDIGSQTVPEIAVSILAELISRRNRGTTTLSAHEPVQPETMA